MDNVLMGNTQFDQAGSDKFGEAPVETRRPIDSSPPKPVDAPPFKGGIDAEAAQGAPTQPGGEQPTDETTEPAPAMNNTLLIAGGLALLYFLFKRRK